MSSNIAQQRKQVEQLRIEAQVQRSPVSQSIRKMVEYCNSNMTRDVLITGFPAGKDNPFKEKNSCVIL